MGVGSVSSMNSMPSAQMAMARSADVKSKKIKNEITDAQQQMQKLSSKEGLSIDEKANERKKWQKEITSLGTELKRHQDELRMSRNREIMMAKLQKGGEPDTAEEETKAIEQDRDTGRRERVIVQNSDGTVILKGEINQDKKQTDEAKESTEKESIEKESTEKESIKKESTEKEAESTEDKNAGMSGKEIHAIISGDASAQQTNLRGTVIAKIRDGIAVLKGEINQDERHGVNTDKKQENLEKLEKKEENAVTFPFSSAFGEEKFKVSGI